MHGRLAAAIHHRLAKALSFWGWSQGAVCAYQDAIAAEPRLAAAHFGLGEEWARRRRWAEAAAAFDAAARLQPASPEPVGNLALCLARAGRWSDSVEALARLIIIRPEEAEPRVLQGLVLRRIGRPADA